MFRGRVLVDRLPRQLLPAIIETEGPGDTLGNRASRGWGVQVGGGQVRPFDGRQGGLVRMGFDQKSVLFLMGFFNSRNSVSALFKVKSRHLEALPSGPVLQIGTEAVP